MHWKPCLASIFCLFVACNYTPTAARAGDDTGLDVGALVINARIVRNTMDPVETLTENGHHVTITGPIACTQGETAELRVTVTQRQTGAVADGSSRINCTGSDQMWTVRLQKQGKEVFQEGPATAVAFARTSDRGNVTTRISGS